MNIFINLYGNSSIDCNKKKIKIKYMICIIILFIIININKAILLLIHVTIVMGNFDLEPNFPTNPMGSSGPLVV